MGADKSTQSWEVGHEFYRLSRCLVVPCVRPSGSWGLTDAMLIKVDGVEKQCGLSNSMIVRMVISIE